MPPNNSCSFFNSLFRGYDYEGGPLKSLYDVLNESTYSFHIAFCFAFCFTSGKSILIIGADASKRNHSTGA